MDQVTVAKDADKLVCACFGLTAAKLVNEFELAGTSYDRLVAATGVGTKCTACLLDLDLLLDGVVRRHPHRPGQGPAAARGFFVKSEDQCHCGHFIHRDGVTTTLRVANHGLLFDTGSPVVAHDFRLVVFASDGRKAYQQTGRIGAHQTFQFRFGDIVKPPPSGWFIIDLIPRGRGVVGSLRPQIGISGPHWAATYHPQWLAFRTLRRGVLAAVENGRLDLCPVLINPDNVAANVSVSVRGVDAQFLVERTLRVGSRCLAEIDLAELTVPVTNGTVLCQIEASRPISYYIINKHRDGTWCVDHFPNQK